MRSLRLKISVSGVRGVVGETLTPQLLARFSQAYGTYVGQGKVLVGRDTRPSGPMVANAVFSGLLSTGCAPLDVGIAPIPAIQHRAATRHDVVGAIAITASHNPAEWNALKLLSAEGLFLSNLEATELSDIYNQGAFRRMSGTRIPTVGRDDEAISAHTEAVLAQIDVAKIRAARIPVAIDCVNGAGAVETPILLSELGCTVVRLSCDPTGDFVRPPEPLPQNLMELCEVVSRGGVRIGLAQDADADRLAVVDERGVALEGDEMLAVLIELALRRSPGPVVVNLSTSDLIEHVAARHQVPVFRTPVGEANVVAGMLQHRAVVGGEGSGGLIYPAVHTCRDSFVGMALLLEHLASGGTVSSLVDELPRRVRRAQKVPMAGTAARRVVHQLRQTLRDAEIDLRDGLKATFPEGWLHVRPSNTEPILRVHVEADSEASADALQKKVAEELATLGRDA
ncbi:MAG: phosphoglucosamine mutase [Proteobacteria bacterium]|nr:MAG: phosphoglucosamine mutase [Pseudomonadota bacterium]